MEGAGPGDASVETPWLVLSSHLQHLVAHRSGRTDVVVRIAPEAPPVPTWTGGYRHDIAEVLLDSRSTLGAQVARPEDVDLSQAESRAKHLNLTAACVMAAAHAAHTRFDLTVDVPRAAARAALNLERARVSAAYVRDHPADRSWIRIEVAAHPAQSTIDGIGLLALSSAGILAAHEVRDLADEISTRLGPLRTQRLLEVIERSISLPDDMHDELTSCAFEVAGLLGLSDPSHTSAAASMPSDETVVDVARTLQRTVSGTASRLTRARSGVHERTSPDDHGTAVRAYAQAAARHTFRSTASAPKGRVREPDEELRTMARGLAMQLRRSRYRAPAISTRPSALPPGRLHMAEVVRREAQRAAQVPLTARPWRQSSRRTVEQPPFRVGLSWDISSSMLPLHTAMADLVWALSWAAAWSGGTVASAAWNSRVAPLTWPGRVPGRVLEPDCGGGSGGCAESIRALDGVLGLSAGDGARLLVVVTDGAIGNRRLVHAEISDLVRSGTRTVWVTPKVDPRTPPDAVNLALPDPRSLSRELARVICSTLEETHV